MIDIPVERQVELLEKYMPSALVGLQDFIVCSLAFGGLVDLAMERGEGYFCEYGSVSWNKTEAELIDDISEELADILVYMCMRLHRIEVDAGLLELGEMPDEE